MKKIALILCLLLSTARIFAQTFSTYDPRDEIFQYEVKLIDEFLERFNDDKGSYIRKVYEKKKKPFNLTRDQLIVSLFNRANPSWNIEDVNAFRKQVLNPDQPQLLYFEDSNWYAEARGVFLFGQKEIEIPILLHIKTTDPRGSKWMIAGIGNLGFLKDTLVTRNTPSGQSAATKFIATTSYATNFVELHRAFEDKKDIGVFFDPLLLATPNGQLFIQSLMNEKLRFSFVRDIKFHFYQLDNWIFTVEQFKRKSTNTGWLISNLKRVTKDEKELYRRKLLFRI